jgi:predicted CoA-binding protein
VSDTTDIPTLRRILHDNRVIAVVGLSANWHRPSNFAAKYLQEHGYRVIPVNPAYPEVLGERCYPDLESLREPVDVVEIFRRSDHVPPLVDAAIAIGARVVWMQIGVVHEAAAAQARAAGLDVVMDRCMKIEHARLFGGLNFVGVNTGIISAHRPLHIAN